MNFRTEININTVFPKIQHHEGIFLSGSCFSENIGQKLSALKFRVLCNPFGITYNPVSILEELSIIQNPNYINVDGILERDQGFFHYNFHSSITAESKEQLKEKITEFAHKSKSFIQQGEWAFITLGTAVVYRLTENNKIVGNCHQQPAQSFRKEVLRVSEVSKIIEEIIATLQQINPNIKTCFTVSPVKHLRDGAELNSRSKSTLIAAIHENLLYQSNVYYFPAFEVMNEDLRDYRFYATDMMHPSEQAIDYIFEKFSGSFFDEDTIQLMQQIVKIQKLAQHRPLRATKTSLLSIQTKGLKMIEELSKKKVGLDFEAERKYFYDLY